MSGRTRLLETLAQSFNFSPAGCQHNLWPCSSLISHFRHPRAFSCPRPESCRTWLVCPRMRLSPRRVAAARSVARSLRQNSKRWITIGSRCTLIRKREIDESDLCPGLSRSAARYGSPFSTFGGNVILGNVHATTRFSLYLLSCIPIGRGYS